MASHLSAGGRLLFQNLLTDSSNDLGLLSDGLTAPGWQTGGDLERLKIGEDGVLVCPELMKECLWSLKMLVKSEWRDVQCFHTRDKT